MSQIPPIPVFLDRRSQSAPVVDLPKRSSSLVAELRRARTKARTDQKRRRKALANAKRDAEIAYDRLFPRGPLPQATTATAEQRMIYDELLARARRARGLP